MTSKYERFGFSSARDIFEKYNLRMRRYIKSLTHDSNSIDDITQEAFIEIFRSIDNVKSPEYLQSWIFGVTRYTVLHHYRRNKKHENNCDLTLANSIEDRNKDSYEITLDREYLDLTLKIVGDLSSQKRVPLLLMTIEGLNTQEVSDKLGIPKSTVLTRIYYARRELRKKFKENVGEI